MLSWQKFCLYMILSHSAYDKDSVVVAVLQSWSSSIMIHSHRLSGSIQQISLRKYHSKEKLFEKVLLINYRIQPAFVFLKWRLSYLRLSHHPLQNRLWRRLTTNNVSCCNLLLSPPLIINYIGLTSRSIKLLRLLRSFKLRKLLQK